MLANDLIHYIYKDAVTIAEDVSGYVKIYEDQSLAYIM